MISIYNPNLTLLAHEKQIILASYRYHRGNRVSTARALGITTKTLYNKLKSYEETKDEVEVNAEKPNS